MKSIYRGVLVAFAAAFVMGAFGASAALAAPEWYSSATKPAPEWQQGKAKLTETVAVKTSGKVKLYDEGIPAEIECESSGAGTVGPGAVGKTTSWTMSACKPTSKALSSKGEEVTNGCGTVVKAEMRGLSWSSELAGSSIHNSIVGEGAKPLGFSMECKTDGITVNDVCTTEKLDPTVGNSSGGVSETFYYENKLNCTLGGKEVGMLATGQEVQASKGAALEVNYVEGSYVKVTSSIAIKGGRSLLKLQDKNRGLGVECWLKVEGTVGTGGKGTITSTPVETCYGSGNCGKVTSTDADYLPWNTELYESEGAIRDRIVSGGTGTPKWYFKCEPEDVEVECNMNVSPEILNGLEGGVLAEFSERLTKAVCRYDSKEGEAFWSGEINIAPTSGAIKAEK